ncbi:MAG: HAMP domain-containing histidine kinase [Gammaproteobacteria bacterium]|nr:HAMP domain-containing histidine kinase [Gammaproteobacteria bacterium]
MTFYRATSSRYLILTGFFLLALLLIIGQLSAITSVDRLSRQGKSWIYEAAETLHLSQLLATHITSLERAARQYEVVRNRALYQVYLERHGRFQEDAARLAAHTLTEAQQQRLETLRDEEDAIFEVLDANSPAAEARAAIDKFAALDVVSRAILAESGTLVGQAVDQIQEAASETKHRLVYQAVALIPAALMLAAIYSALINRPIRQMARAIRALGDGKFVEPLRVTGPRDLEELGKQLDWLRLRLRGLEQHKVTILRNISHELKTPLAALREGIELMHDEVPGTLNRQQAEIVRILQTNSVRLHKLIDDLINFSIAQAEDPFLNDRPVQLHRLLERTVQEQQPSLSARRLQVRCEYTEATVVGDQEKLKSIFDNLLSNAIKYSPEGGEIFVQLQRAEGKAVVDVCDQGPGIDMSERTKVFDAFYQGQAATKARVRGSGLGLSIAHAYTRVHKGTIEVLDSVHGAHLRVALPLAGA